MYFKCALYFLFRFSVHPGDDHPQTSPHTPPHLKDDPREGEPATEGQGSKVDLDQVIMELNSFPEDNGATGGRSRDLFPSSSRFPGNIVQISLPHA